MVTLEGFGVFEVGGALLDDGCVGWSVWVGGLIVGGSTVGGLGVGGVGAVVGGTTEDVVEVIVGVGEIGPGGMITGADIVIRNEDGDEK